MSRLRRPIASDTRAPVLYMTLNNARSRRPAQVVASGASSIARISSRVRKPSIGLSNRFIGMDNACSMTASAVRSWCAAYFRKDRKAASRALRLRTAFLRSFSR